jgi:hypothetical protein
VTPVIKGLIGAVIAGVGVGIMVSASREMRAGLAPCVDCEESPEETAVEVAEASAELAGDAEVVVADDDG